MHSRPPRSAWVSRRVRTRRDVGALNHDALLYGALAAAANLAGAAALTSNARWTVRVLDKLVALAAGFMIAVALADLLPEAIARDGERGALLALAGYVLVHLTQHILAPHFHFGEETHEVTRAASVSALVGLMLHTFVDGVAIASGFAVSARVGARVFTAILLHKLPEGLAITSLFLAAGATRHQAFRAAALLGVATLAGVFLAEWLPFVARHGLPLAAGVTLYVGASNLVPELQRGGKHARAVSFFAGCALYFVARLVSH